MNNNEDKKHIDEDARFRSYFNMPLNGIAITSIEKGWLEVNDKICSMLGYTREEILKMTWVEMTHPDDIATDEKEFNRILSGEIEQYNIDKRFICKNKSILWTNLSVGCVRKNDGKVDYTIAIIVDITEHKLMEKKLQEQNSLMNTILENAPIGFAVNNIDNGKTIFISSKFEQIYGLEKDSIQNINDFFEKVYIDTEYREKIRNKIMKDMASGDIKQMKWENIPITTRTGEKKFLTAINIPILDQNLMVSTVQDVTKKKLDEIEKMNKLMIGRELEMIRLKEEIKENK
jgi:two-component system, chemotaxis family, CheB/CheR fusion protein